MKIPILNIDQFKELEPLNGVYVNSLSNHIHLNKDLINKPHSHNFYLCVIFTKGTGTHEIDFNSYEISPGRVFFLKPGQTHFWKFKSKPEGYIFFHSQEFYEMKFLKHKLHSFPFFYSYQNPPILELTTKKLAELDFMFQEVYTEYVQTNLLRELKLINSLSNIYIELTMAYTVDINFKKFDSPNYYSILENLENLIETHFYKSERKTQ